MATNINAQWDAGYEAGRSEGLDKGYEDGFRDAVTEASALLQAYIGRTKRAPAGLRPLIKFLAKDD